MASEYLALERLNIHQVTLMQCDFRESIECLARHGVAGTTLWLDKLDETSLNDAVRIVNDNGIRVDALCPGGLLTATNPSAFTAAIDLNRKRLDQAAALGARSLVVITGGLSDGDKDIQAARARALAGMRQLVSYARNLNVKLALEPLHPMVCGFRSVISTISDAVEFLGELDAEDITGLAIDSYALWWEPRLHEQLIKVAPRVLHFHASDWLRETEDLRLDRGMPGDGIIDNRRIREHMEQGGFTGPVEVEIFSLKDWWRRPCDEVVQTIVERMEMYL